MQKTFLLKGLDCPHCAGEIEKEVSRLSGVSKANVNLINQTLTVSFEGSEDELFKMIEKTVHSHEPGVVVSEHLANKKDDCHEGCDCHSHTADAHGDHHTDKSTLPRIIAGAAVFAIGIALGLITDLNTYIKLAFMLAAYLILGTDIIIKALKNIIKGRVFDENFLMTLSTLGAFAIGEYPEAAAVMLFYQIGEYFQARAVRRSRRSIEELMELCPDFAHLITENGIQTVAPETVSVGDIILIKPGERIPLDGTVLEGVSSLDTKALTGEALPRHVEVGDEVISGCINQSGALTVKVSKSFENSTASKILELVENASAKKATAENFITAFARYYTPAVVILAALLAIIPPLALGTGWTDWLHRAMVFLVISCPCALVISIPLTFFGGIGAASRHGILVKGGNYLEALGKLNTVVFDKTGTLTKGSFKVSSIDTANECSKDLVLEYAAKAESLSNHPIARSIIEEYGKETNTKCISDCKEIAGRGVIAVIDGKSVTVGSAEMLHSCGIDFPKYNDTGTNIYVALDNVYIGHILISDEIKPDSLDAVLNIKRLGIEKTVMLTGDGELAARTVADILSIDEYHHSLLPHEKLEKLEMIDKQKSVGGTLAFVGDGINDAPVLARADVGIAMGALGSDAAIEAADVVLMTDEPSKLVDAINISKATRRIVIQNIVITLTVKAAFLTLGAFGLAGMWEAVFGDVGVALIAVLNSMRILKK